MTNEKFCPPSSETPSVREVVDKLSPVDEGLKSSHNLIEEVIKPPSPINMEELRNGRYKLESWNSSDLSPATIREMSDFFRYIFSNSEDHSWGQYACCPDCDLIIPASEVFSSGDIDVPIETIDNECLLPDCNECGSQNYFLQDPERTFQFLSEKFRHPGWTILLRDQENEDKLAGMIFGYVATLHEAFKSEEWEDPYLYSKIPGELRSKNLRDFLPFQQEFVSSCDLKTADTPMIILNCMAIDRELARGTGLFSNLADRFLQTIPESERHMPIISETVSGNVMHSILTRVGASEVKHSFGEESVIMVYNWSDFYNVFAPK